MSEYPFDSGRSVSKPMSNKDIASFLESVSKKTASGTSKPFTSEDRTSFNSTGFTEDTALVDSVTKLYAGALDSVGLNLVDPLQSYYKLFKKNMQTLGLDPQRPGNSYVFFTRPDLNFSFQNVQQLPFFNYLLKSKVGNLVANYLQYPDTPGLASCVDIEARFKSTSAFSPLLTNTCKELSGLKDMSMEKYETEGDFNGRQLTYAQGSDGYDSIGEVNATFEDASSSPLFLLHFLWFQYIHEVCKGTIHPRMIYIQERIIDYTCSIYTFKLAEDNETIIRWAKLTGCYPLNVPMGTLNHSRDTKLDEFDELSITYAFNAYEPMNPRALADFNVLAMREAFPANTDFSPEAIAKATLNLEPALYPDKLLEGSDNPERFNSLWARTPIVVGNKLLFV